MSKIRVIELNKGDGMTLTASAAVVMDDGVNTLVDPGSVGDMDTLIRIVETHGINWESISQVFYTHLHFDHYETTRFPKNIKKVFVPTKEVLYIRHLMALQADVQAYKNFLSTSHEWIAAPFLRQFVHYRYDERYSNDALKPSATVVHYDGEFQVSNNAWSFPLPGHCVGLHGLRLDMATGPGLIASDAVLSESDWLDNDVKRHLIMFDCDAWQQSREKLKTFSWVLPGHGSSFCPHSINEKAGSVEEKLQV